MSKKRPQHMIMKSFSFSLVSLLSLISFAVYACCSADFSRHDFPAGFVFGAGSSAYQVEGAAKEGGRTPSIWDTFADAGFSPGGNGDISADQYHRYKEDVQLMLDLGIDAYRLSISWSRLIPNGRGAVNPVGLNYYNNLIDQLTANGIEPHVTLHHSDLPQCLEDEYGGWLDRRIIEDFTAYANVCFHHFGDRVTHWTTLNEANVFTVGGYDEGVLPPQHCSHGFRISCRRGNSSVEPYLVAHNMLLAHGSVAKLYRQKYQGNQHGEVGINLFGFSFYPATDATEDEKATQIANDFLLGWFMHPLVFGDYPSSMKETVGVRLPSFTQNEARMVEGSAAFVGLNHYFAVAVKSKSSGEKAEIEDVLGDIGVEMDLLPAKGMGLVNEFQYPIEPWGLQKLLQLFKLSYGNIPVYIHENGQTMSRNISRSMALNDEARVEYMKGFIGGTLDAIRNGSNTKGYFYWSFLDMIELLDGYRYGFGLYYLDLEDPNLVRYPKLSAYWYSNFLKGAGTIHLNTDELVKPGAHHAHYS
uniref:Beta-glucosidase n=1 Tax=Kalanchoe fedtschenkoi TaxID=63787 RepID=A0A7N1A0M9_KALFE